VSAISICHQVAADYLIHSAVDISNPCQQGNTCAGMSAASGLVRSYIINSLGAGEIVGAGNPLLSPTLVTGAFPDSDASAAVLLSTGRSLYLPTQSQALYHSASSGPSYHTTSAGSSSILLL